MQKFDQIKVAKVISYLFNPIFMPTLGILLIFNSGTYLSYIPQEGKNLILSVVFSGTFLVPMCFVPLYMYLKIIKNVEIEERGQRIVPYAITWVAYACTYYLLSRVPVPVINAFIIAVCIVLLMNIFILIKRKISTHMIALGGIVGLVVALMFRLNADLLVYLLLGILVSGLVASSRLFLQKHSPAEVYSGFILGVAVVLVSVLFL